MPLEIPSSLIQFFHRVLATWCYAQSADLLSRYLVAMQSGLLMAVALLKSSHQIRIGRRIA